LTIDNNEQIFFYGNELIIDLECDDLNISTAKIKFVSAYSFKNKKKYFFSFKDNIDFLKKLIEEHYILIGHNISGYDIPVLLNNEIDSVRYKVRVDTLKIARERLNLMFNSKGERIHAVRFNLNEVHNKLFPDTSSKILDFDYSILKKDINVLTLQELKLIREYSLNDIRITKNIFKEFCKQFIHFRDLMNLENQKKYKWLTRNFGSYSYSVFCNLLNIDEIYDENTSFVHNAYIGGYMIEPRYREFIGDCYIFDFTSQYPHNFFQFNLYTPAENCSCGNKCNYKFIGNEYFNIEGEYCVKELGKKEKILKWIYEKRKEYKDIKDNRELPFKVVLNSAYGISAKPLFKNLYYKYSASDCCLLGRQELKHLDNFLRNKGYLVGYGFTDSVFVKDIYKNKTKLLNNIVEFLEIIKQYIPFPSDTFKLNCSNLKAVWFFKKQMYMYINENNNLIVKGLSIKKDNATKISKHIFEKYLTPLIIENKKIQFNKSKIKKMIIKILREDITLAATTFNINNDSEYYTSEFSLQKQIKEKYGSGKLELVKNFRRGVGKNVKYCSIEEAKKLSFIDLDLTKVWKELGIFIDDRQEVLIKNG